jgi:hypothetical protein
VGPWRGLGSGTVAGEVESCALAKAKEQLDDALSYYDKPIEEEDRTLRWLELASTAGVSADANDHLSAPVGTVVAPLVVLERSGGDFAAAGSSVWRGVGRAVAEQRRREWTMVALRRWEHAAYRAARDELEVLLLSDRGHQ